MTATVPSRERSRASSSATRSGARLAPEELARVEIVAQQQVDVRLARVERVDRAPDLVQPGVGDPGVQVGHDPGAQPGEPLGPVRQLELELAHDEPPRLDPPGPRGEAGDGETGAGGDRGGEGARHRAASTSSRLGMPPRAPSRRVESAAATSANAAASRSGRPRASSAASAPLTVSPAPVVSTTSTAGRRQALHRAARLEQQRAVAAERDQHRRARVGHEPRGGVGGIGAAGELLGLRRVGREDGERARTADHARAPG